jgi:hypothetical protein
VLLLPLLAGGATALLMLPPRSLLASVLLLSTGAAATWLGAAAGSAAAVDIRGSSEGLRWQPGFDSVPRAHLATTQQAAETANSHAQRVQRCVRCARGGGPVSGRMDDCAGPCDIQGSACLRAAARPIGLGPPGPAAQAAVQMQRGSGGRVLRWKADDEAAAVEDAHEHEHEDEAEAGDDAAPSPERGPFKPSMRDDVHYDPQRDHRDRDHGSLGEKHLNAAKKDHDRHVKRKIHKDIKRMKERIHDSVSRPEL